MTNFTPMDHFDEYLPLENATTGHDVNNEVVGRDARASVTELE